MWQSMQCGFVITLLLILWLCFKITIFLSFKLRFDVSFLHVLLVYLRLYQTCAVLTFFTLRNHAFIQEFQSCYIVLRSPWVRTDRQMRLQMLAWYVQKTFGKGRSVIYACSENVLLTFSEHHLNVVRKRSWNVNWWCKLTSSERFMATSNERSCGRSLHVHWTFTASWEVTWAGGKWHLHHAIGLPRVSPT